MIEMNGLGRVGVLILAAGAGRRMRGSTPKLLLPMPGREGCTILEQTIRNALVPGFSDVLVALGPQIRAFLGVLDREEQSRTLRFLVNPEHSEGRAATIRAGVLHADPMLEHLLILCGDQPGLEPSLLAKLARHHMAGSHPVSFPRRPDGGRGWPTIWSRCLFPQLAEVSGDQGAYALLRSLAPRAGQLPLEESELAGQADLDTPEDYRTWTCLSIQ